MKQTFMDIQSMEMFLIRVDNNCAIGDIVDKLGRYEDICDDPERLKEMVKEKGIPEQ